MVHCVYGHSAVICANTVEPIEMPFGLWARMGPENHGIRWGPGLPYKGVIIMGKNMPGHAGRHFTVSCAKMAEPIDLPFGLWTRVD